MKSRKIVVLVASAALLAAPLASSPALAQGRGPMVATPELTGGYLMPVMVGVMVGALVWPLVVAAAAETVVVGGATRMAAPAGAAVAPVAAGVAAAAEAVGAAGAAIPAAAATGWQAVLATPAYVGAIMGGLVGYIVAR